MAIQRIGSSGFEPQICTSQVAHPEETAPAAQEAAVARGSSSGRPPVPTAPPTAPPSGEKTDALERHIRFFDRNGDSLITRAEIHKGMVEMGFSSITASLVAPVLAAGLPDRVDDIKTGTRHPDSGSFKKDGRFDQAAFDRWFETTDRNDNESLSNYELLRSSLSMADNPLTFLVSSGELQLMHSLLAKDGQAPRQAVQDFFSGKFLDDIVAARRPE